MRNCTPSAQITFVQNSDSEDSIIARPVKDLRPKSVLSQSVKKRRPFSPSQLGYDEAVRRQALPSRRPQTQMTYMQALSKGEPTHKTKHPNADLKMVRTSQKDVKVIHKNALSNSLRTSNTFGAES
jgi:hypothetical protein